MPALFRRQSNIQCFFCNSAIPIPVNTRNFKCPSCACWNRYDERGEIISDEPAMHDEHLNSRSFAKRARIVCLRCTAPARSAIRARRTRCSSSTCYPTTYLRPRRSPEYQSRVDMLPAYRESLHARYPPVCDACLPQVEEEIRQKEQMARAKALGGWLSKGKERKRRVSSGPDMEREKVLAPETVFWWKVRGALWVLCLVVSVVGSGSAAYGRHPFVRLTFLHPLLPLLAALSLLWTAWDPTYASYRKAQVQGRDVRIQGKRTYNMLQISAWSIRFLSSIILCIRWFNAHSTVIPWSNDNRIYPLTVLCIELITITASCSVLRIQQPPSIRLIDTHSHNRLDDKSRSSTPNPTSAPPRSSSVTRFPSTLPEHDALATLSLSSKPVVVAQPIFGLPSLHGASMPSRMEEPAADDAMDWSPTNPDGSSSSPAFGGKRPASSSTENDNWLRPQKFFAPEKPTGLEGLLEGARIQDEPMPYEPADGPRGRGRGERSGAVANHLWIYGPFYVLGIALLVVGVHYTLKWAGLAK
ncbi:unnamed protein product [Cyclocybe aegerita]|uniref:Ima1 N-terminal domain-containing protein n=1 Tax=Cyclocybe aegerita TaxID=1973307 RepID=A0A8S0W645_CYCAE|nr:unnamed protein product [Cyclocybe aegerita]